MPLAAGLLIIGGALATMALALYMTRRSASDRIAWMSIVPTPLFSSMAIVLIAWPGGGENRFVGLLILGLNLGGVVLALVVHRSGPKSLLWRGPTFEQARTRISDAFRRANISVREEAPGRWAMPYGTMTLDPRRNLIGRWTTRIDMADPRARRSLARALQDASPQRFFPAAAILYGLAGAAGVVAGVLLATA